MHFVYMHIYSRDEVLRLCIKRLSSRIYLATTFLDTSAPINSQIFRFEQVVQGQERYHRNCVLIKLKPLLARR